ncbi:ABC transporter permease [Corynebacterium variabile]|uniref:ABC-type dipeptide/oligopeptide/nickel transport systems, permease components n=2 Tax=Corynebacterium variabile TaxID=1727 RepID=A0A0X2NL27_9CORY|nr:ABC transporter permease [Corynebacterium variabile]MDN6241416.1 ABC transporter permease [Corynebacterium variabile]MDN6477626.1 ABC transporter permease [Corynebacterium variabile]MDN6536132.1 ABC transporter permease [Corynebacterium variabile]MDN6620096.1 ABC transporter permease [Corynebacterium variabile]MDN6662418.1 ABC transporter permease [Corynebacterium variabile]
MKTLTRIRPGVWIAGLIVLLAVAWALVPGLFASGDPTESGTTEPLLAPSGDHWFGTDAVGRDLYTRVVWGARHSLSGALVAVLVGMVVGTLLGLVAGSVRGGRNGWLDTLIMRIVDVLLSIPALLLSLSVIILLGYGTMNAAIAVGVTNVAMFARLARSEVLGVAAADFVEAAYGSGGTAWSVLWRHILPNSLTPVLALAALQFGSAILQLSTLGFLGYGAPPPTPEWGLIISEGRDFIATSWWLSVLPGLAIVLVVLATNYLSQALQRSGGKEIR